MLEAQKLFKPGKCSKCRAKIEAGEVVLVETQPGGQRKEYCRSHGTDRLIAERQHIFKIEKEIYGNGGS
jgi:hypothetical protein